MAGIVLRMSELAESPVDPVSDVSSADGKLGVFLAIAGAIGTYASTTLTLDKISLLEAQADGVEITLGCDLSAFVSCTSVIQTEQASAFGFPNPFLGMVAFAALTMLGVVMASGFRLPRWMWLGLQAGVTLGVAFTMWLQYESIYRIGALCPWCMVVWAVMIPLFVVVTRRVTGWRFLRDWTGLVIALWFIALGAMIWFQFGSSLWGA